jgi:hypothetical protein
MLNYSKKSDIYKTKLKLLLNDIANKRGFLLAFRVWGNGTEVFDTFLPPQNIYKRLDDKSYLIAWLLEGYFLTKGNQELLKDIIKRQIETLLKAGAVRVEWVGWINFARLSDNDILHLNAYNLRDDIAPYLENIKKDKREYKVLELLATHTEYKESDDAFFDWLRFKVYDFVRENGKNALTLDYCKELAIIGYEIMGHKKGISTPLAKAKNIYNWVIENYNPKGSNWNYKRKLTDEELEMTRKERALKNSQAQYEKAHKKIMSLITGMFKDDYKKKSGKWHISKIANDLGMSRDTIRKHLKDENLI